jgi:hypothetical protein
MGEKEESITKQQMAAFMAELRSIREWKDRQEAVKAERLAGMRNKIVDMFAEQGANVDEALSVLGILEHEYREKFISSSKGK